MPAGEQNFKVYLTFKDEATGKFVKATEDQIAAVRKMGVVAAKEGTVSAVAVEKVGKSMQETVRHTRYLGEEVSRLAGKIGSMRNMILVWMFALRPLIGQIKTSITAAIDQENAEMKLTAAFAATGKGTAQSVKSLAEYANKLQFTTGVADEYIISAQAVLANFRFTDAQIKAAIPTILDVAAAKQKLGESDADVESVAKRVGLALSGNASMLQRLGIVIDESVRKHGDFNDILQSIQKSAGGMSTLMASTFQGQVNIAKAAISEFHEQLGYIITKSPVVISALQMMTGEMIKMSENMNSSREATNNFLGSWNRVAAAIIGVVDSIKFLWRTILQMGRIVVVVFDGIAAGLVQIYSFIQRVLSGFIGLSTFPWAKMLSAQMKTSADDIELWASSFTIAMNQTITDYKDGAAVMSGTLDTMVDTYAKIELGAINVIKKQKEMLGLLPQAIDKTKEDTKAVFNAMDTMLTEYATNMRDTLSDGFVKVIKGDFKSLKDTIVNFGDQMLQTISKIIANLIIMSVWKKAAGFLGFSGGFSIQHSGGYILSPSDSSGYGRKKFHSGGEVPAILQEGEGVLSRTGMRSLGVDNLNKLNRGEQAGGGGVTNNYYIQTIDERSFRERLQQHGDIYADASDMAIRDNNSLRQTSQRWG